MRALTFATCVLFVAASLSGCAVPEASREPSTPEDGYGTCEEVDVEYTLDHGHKGRDVPLYGGQSAFAMDPPEPVLTPGEPSPIDVALSNTDCKTLFYRDSWGVCGGDWIWTQVGAFWLTDVGDGVVPYSRNGFFSCGGALGAPVKTVIPGQNLSHRLAWDGSFEAYKVKDGRAYSGWTPQRFWLAPGTWNVTYGALGESSWDVKRNTTFTVAENHLNADGAISQDSCPGRFGERILSNATAQLSTPSARLGDTVRITLRLTFPMDGPGCQIFAGLPYFMASREPATDWRDTACLPSRCGSVGFHDVVLVESGRSVADVTVVLVWNGTRTDRAAAPGDMVRPGVYNLSISPYNGYFSGDTIALGTLEWTPAEDETAP